LPQWVLNKIWFVKNNRRYSYLTKILKVHPTYISGIERGKRNLSLKNIERLAMALKVPMNELLQ